MNTKAFKIFMLSELEKLPTHFDGTLKRATRIAWFSGQFVLAKLADIPTIKRCVKALSDKEYQPNYSTYKPSHANLNDALIQGIASFTPNPEAVRVVKAENEESPGLIKTEKRKYTEAEFLSLIEDTSFSAWSWTVARDRAIMLAKKTRRPHCVYSLNSSYYQVSVKRPVSGKYYECTVKGNEVTLKTIDATKERKAILAVKLSKPQKRKGKK